MNPIDTEPRPGIEKNIANPTAMNAIATITAIVGPFILPLSKDVLYTFTYIDYVREVQIEVL